MTRKNSTAPARITLVEDDPIVGESLQERLQLEGYECDWYATASEALAGLSRHPCDLILSDIRLPDMNGEALHQRLQQQLPERPPVVFITGYGSIEQAVQLLHQGAADYLTKPLDLPALLSRIRDLLSRTSHGSESPVADDVAPGMRPFFEKIPRLAPHRDSPILIQGESGVGKEVLARHIHDELCPEAPFEAINCAAIPKELAASELFGHEKGAFTGAHQEHAGAFERAATGVLFLDEIGDMPLSLQTQLLRVIQERSFQRLGGESELAFEGRLICATHQDLRLLVDQGRFREDLYYRLNVIPFEIPPLRKRPADILWLTEQFLIENAHRIGRDTPLHIHPEARQALLAYPWPGNVRELKNLIDRACIFCEGDELSLDLLGLPSTSPTGDLRSTRSEAEREGILQALELNQGRMQKTADALGISRKTLWEKMKKLGIERP